MTGCVVSGSQCVVSQCVASQCDVQALHADLLGFIAKPLVLLVLAWMRFPSRLTVLTRLCRGVP